MLVVTPTELIRRLQPPPAAIPPEITAAIHPTNPRQRSVYAAASLGLIALVSFLVLSFVDDPGFTARARPPAPVEGLTIFAVFFVGALAVERLLEPIAGILLPKAEKSAEVEEKASTAAGKIAHAANAPGAGFGSVATAEANDAVRAAAKAKAELTDLVWARTVVYWALASSVGIFVAAAMKLYLLRTVGIGDADRWLEVLATGLIIGAGTKPLHDLTKLITAQKEAKQAAA